MSAVQTSRLHDSSAMKRLATAVQCTLHSVSFEPYSKERTFVNNVQTNMHEIVVLFPII